MNFSQGREHFSNTIYLLTDDKWSSFSQKQSKLSGRHKTPSWWFFRSIVSELWPSKWPRFLERPFFSNPRHSLWIWNFWEVRFSSPFWSWCTCPAASGTASVPFSNFHFLAIFNTFSFLYIEFFLQTNWVEILQGDANYSSLEGHRFRMHQLPLAQKNL